MWAVFGLLYDEYAAKLRKNPSSRDDFRKNLPVRGRKMRKISLLEGAGGAKRSKGGAKIGEGVAKVGGAVAVAEAERGSVF